MTKIAIVLGDQLNHDSTLYNQIDAAKDVVVMAEVLEEANHVWSHKARIALFFSAMRHFADELARRGFLVHYHRYSEHSFSSLAECIDFEITKVSPDEVVVVEPGEHRVATSIQKVARSANVALSILEDNHFAIPQSTFNTWAKGRKLFRLEHFYRMARRNTNLLMKEDQPVGGRWNFDSENRSGFPRSGPPFGTVRKKFAIDDLTSEVFNLVEEHFSNHPGSLDNFSWPTTRKEALEALDDFVENHLVHFGKYQDAMWGGEPFLSHSLLSAALNLKLLSPLEICYRAQEAYNQGVAPIEAVEGFIRQIIGWREYVRGLYFYFGENWTNWNHLNANERLPQWYWSGEVDMVCLSETIGQSLEYGYAHHIQRLMVTGLFALLWGADPIEVHQWYLAIYVDAVEWVEAPNVIGMSQYADGGIMASKPYIASGAYISKMSNYCTKCRFSPTKATGEDSCPFTTLYWSFIDRHRDMLRTNPRLALQVKNLEKKPTQEIVEIRKRGAEVHDRWGQRR
ncbi:MAG: cryptochrome/photolyase family protein [Actinomycetota bacterium]|nr:cryptochrome/photolyase family protein [Actinomycetota bacterium]